MEVDMFFLNGDRDSVDYISKQPVEPIASPQLQLESRAGLVIHNETR
jgi:hypothetical protein